jgi:hypothetical protein
MSCQHSTGDGEAVAIAVPADQARFLRRVLEAARAGVRDDLAQSADTLPDPVRARREEAAYGRLLRALDGAAIEPDRGLLDALADLARVVDADNEFDRVAEEHAALWGLVGQLRRSAGR